MAKTAPEIIGFHLGWDMRDVSEQRYQPTRFTSPGVYTIGDAYFCCPSGSQKLPVDREVKDRWKWEKVGSYYGRDVFRAAS